MRYQRVTDIVRLAIRLQGTLGGLTLDDISEEFSVSRRTAERMRDAVNAAFGPLQLVDRDDRRRHWQLRSSAICRFIRISAEELAEIDSAAKSLDPTGLVERAVMLRELAEKLRALRSPLAAEEFDADLEVLMRAEGLAMRPGPRPHVEKGLLSLLRDAIKARRAVEFDYISQSTGRCSLQRVQPYGVLYGNRAFLVAWTDWADDMRLWRLGNISSVRATGETFERDRSFDLRRYAERSFGTFQESPVEVVLRFEAGVAGDAAAFLFHPSQSLTKHPDGSLTVRFKAGGLDEMCWHLFTWGASVTVDNPVSLRRRLARMCASLAAHHDARSARRDAPATDSDLATNPQT